MLLQKAVAIATTFEMESYRITPSDLAQPRHVPSFVVAVQLILRSWRSK